MKTEHIEFINDNLGSGLIIESHMDLVQHITRHTALEFYARNTDVLITDGVKLYKIQKGTIVNDWPGMLFSYKFRR